MDQIKDMGYREEDLYCSKHDCHLKRQLVCVSGVISGLLENNCKSPKRGSKVHEFFRCLFDFLICEEVLQRNLPAAFRELQGRCA